MLLPRFEYRHATSLPQATTLLGENPEAQALAGGTDLLVDLRERRPVAIPPEFREQVRAFEGEAIEA